MRRRLLENGEGGYTPDFGEYDIIGLFDVQDISTTTKLSQKGSLTKIEIDGVVQPSVENYYQLTETGIHEVKYKGTSYGYILRDCVTLIEVYFSDKITNVPYQLCLNCTNLRNAHITDNMISWGDSGAAFANCISLENIYVPEGTTTFSGTGGYNGVLAGCTSLKEVVIPSTVSKICGRALKDCTGLQSIICKPTTPPTLAPQEMMTRDYLMHFQNTNNCPIYVPAESVNAYKTANRWTEYASRIFPMPT